MTDIPQRQTMQGLWGHWKDPSYLLLNEKNLCSTPLSRGNTLLLLTLRGSSNESQHAALMARSSCSETGRLLLWSKCEPKTWWIQLLLSASSQMAADLVTYFKGSIHPSLARTKPVVRNRTVFAGHGFQKCCNVYCPACWHLWTLQTSGPAGLLPARNYIGSLRNLQSSGLFATNCSCPSTSVVQKTSIVTNQLEPSILVPLLHLIASPWYDGVPKDCVLHTSNRVLSNSTLIDPRWPKCFSCSLENLWPLSKTTRLHDFWSCFRLLCRKFLRNLVVLSLQLLLCYSWSKEPPQFVSMPSSFLTWFQHLLGTTMF